MNASSFPRFIPASRFIFRAAAAVLAVGAVIGAASAQSVAQLSVARLATEIRELRRLVALLEHDEYLARCQRDVLAKHRGNALKYSNGGKHPLYRLGFVALLQELVQSPSQVDELIDELPPLPATEFIPSKTPFPGGNVLQLGQFCRANQVAVRPGSRAQLALAHLVGDLVQQADLQVAELDARIEQYKAQNIAHTDVLGKLILALAHCRGCHGCHHHGYGYCGFGPAIVLNDPPAGLNSKAYDTTLPRASKQSVPVESARTAGRAIRVSGVRERSTR